MRVTTAGWFWQRRGREGDTLALACSWSMTWGQMLDGLRAEARVDELPEGRGERKRGEVMRGERRRRERRGERRSGMEWIRMKGNQG